MNQNDAVGFLRNLAQVMGGWFVLLDANGIILKYSPELSKTLGMKKLHGQPLSRVFPSLTTMRNSTSYEGTNHTIYTVYKIRMDALCVLLFQENSLLEDYGILKSIVAALNQGIIACNPSGKIVVYNKAYENIDGLAQENVLGNTVQDVYDMDAKTSLLLRAMEEETGYYAHHQVYTTSVGRVVDTIKDVYPLYEKDRVLGAVALVHSYEGAQSWAKEIIRKTLHDQPRPRTIPLWTAQDAAYESEPMKKTVNDSQILGQTQLNLSILGQTGVGKDDLARHLVSCSPRKDHPFFVIDCAAFPPDMMAPLFFGQRHKTTDVLEVGFLQQADGGTILLKNLHFMANGTQEMLQSYLTSGSFYPINSMDKYKADVRFLTVFPCDMETLFTKADITQGLLQQLTTATIYLPTLAQNPQDILPLSCYFLQKTGEKKQLSPQAHQALLQYSWPGNMAELQNVILSAALLCHRGNTLELEHLPHHIATAEPVQFPMVQTGDLNQSLQSLELQIMEAALKRCDNNISAAAKQMGISRQNLQYRMKKHGIIKD